jgi:hypothetical protein
MMPVLRIVDVRNCHVCPSKPCLPQSYSASRRTASHAGFFILSQSGDRPDRYCESLRFETMPSNRHPCARGAHSAAGRVSQHGTFGSGGGLSGGIGVWWPRFGPSSQRPQ